MNLTTRTGWTYLLPSDQTLKDLATVLQLAKRYGVATSLPTPALWQNCIPYSLTLVPCSGALVQTSTRPRIDDIL